MAKFRMSDEEFERQFAEATKRGRERLKLEPRARRAYYDREHNRIVVEMDSGCTFMFPTELAQGLQGASEEDLAAVKVMPPGFDLHWDALDVQFTVAGLMAGVFGTHKWMAELERKVGGANSKAKRAAVRENGTKRRVQTRRAG